MNTQTFRMLPLAASLLAAMFTGCATYRTPGAGVNIGDLAKADFDIREAFKAEPASSFPARVAIARVQASGYYSKTNQCYGRGQFCVVTTRDVEPEAAFERISKLPQVADLALMNRLLLPATLQSNRDLRIAAATLKTDMLLVYTLDTGFNVENTDIGPLALLSLGFLPNKKATVASTASAAIFDVRNSQPTGEWAYKQGYRRMVLIASDYGGSIEHIGGVARTFTEAGGQIIQEIYPPPRTPDFAPYLTQVRRDADVVVTAVFGADALRFVKQYAEFGLRGAIPLVGKAITLEDVLPAQGDDALGVISVFHYSTALDTPENKRFVEAYTARYRRTPTGMSDQGYVGAQMIAKALDAVKGNIENQDGFLAALRRVEVDAPRGKVKLDAFQNPIHTIYIFKVEKRGGVLQNIPIASYPHTSQFWKWTPEQFMAMPAYVDMKGKWVK